MAWSLFLCWERSFWALCYQPGWNVGNTYRRFRTVNVLSARARCAVNVDTQICRVDFDIDIFVNFKTNAELNEV